MLLLLTLTVTLVLSLSREVGVEAAVAGQALDDIELRALVSSAVERALAELALDRGQPATLLSPWRDDEARFRAAPHGAGKFWLLNAELDPGDGRELRYGIRDEASKLNINAATVDQLLALPGMTEEAADAIIDWRDSDDDPQPYGAEAAYYAAIVPPYTPKNGPFESLDELLRVRGVDAAMLWGEDRNRNGILDPGEDDGDRSFPPDDADGILDRGIAEFLTVFSREPNQTSDGRARVVWGSASVDELEDRLIEGGMGGAALDRLRQLKMSNIQVQSLGSLLAFPEIDEMAAAVIFEEIAVVDTPYFSGRINPNTAARPVLLGLPGLDEADVDAIMSRRLEANADLTTPGWLLRAIPRQKLQSIADLVTTRADQFTIQAVAALDRRPARFARVEVLVDRSFVPARILLWRDLTCLGFPLPGERGEGLP